MQAIIHAADIQDRDGGVLLMGSLFGLYPFLLKLYADGGYQGPNFKAGLSQACRQINVEIVKRSELRKFVVLPKRWIVERTIAWPNLNTDFREDLDIKRESAKFRGAWHYVGVVPGVLALRSALPAETGRAA